MTDIDTDKYFLWMQEMEKEGVRFMNVEKTDKKRRAPIMAAVTMIFFMVIVMGILVWAAKVDPIPLPFLLFIMAMPLSVMIGVLLALKERIKQIEGGEEDEARKY